jgi:hydrogenase expression/formation protein HypD
MLEEVFEVTDRQWRGIGVIPASGWRLSDRYADFDAEHRFDVAGIDTPESHPVPRRRGAAGARSSPRVRGLRHHLHAPQPAGATMVSSEGACAAYYQYRPLEVAPVAVTLG